MTGGAATAGVDLASRLRAGARLDPARVPGLSALLQDGAARLGTQLAGRLGIAGTVSVEGATAVDDDGVRGAAGEQVRSDWQAGDGAHPLVCAIGRRSLDALVDASFGGDGRETPDVARPLSPFETTLARDLLADVATSVTQSFEALAPFVIAPAGWDVAGPGRQPRTGAWLQVTFRVDGVADRTELHALVPQALLGAVRSTASRRQTLPMPAVDADPHWAEGVRGEVERTAVVVRAVLAQPGLTLADIVGMRVGTTFGLRASPRGRVDLVCEGQTLAHGLLGQRDGAYTVQVDAAGDLTDIQSNDMDAHR